MLSMHANLTINMQLHFHSYDGFDFEYRFVCGHTPPPPQKCAPFATPHQVCIFHSCKDVLSIIFDCFRLFADSSRVIFDVLVCLLFVMSSLTRAFKHNFF
jgi:hypothetical protein